jgi:hypothetical protein
MPTQILTITSFTSAEDIKACQSAIDNSAAGYGISKATCADTDERCEMLFIKQNVGGALGSALGTKGHTAFSLVFRGALSQLYAGSGLMNRATTGT